MEKKRNFSTLYSRLNLNYKWRSYEFYVNVLLVIVTFLMGFVCQYYVAAESAEGYSNLAYTNALVSVSTDLNSVNRTIEVSSQEISILHGIVSKLDKFSNTDTLSLRYIELLNPLSDSISRIVNKIETSSHVVKIPMSGSARFQSKKTDLDNAIKKLTVFQIMNAIRYENVNNDDEFRLLILSKYNCYLDKSDAQDYYKSYKKWRSPGYHDIIVDSVIIKTLHESDIEWAKYLHNDVMPSLETVSRIYNDFANFNYSSSKLMKKTNNRSLIFLAAVMILCITILFIGFKFIPFPDRNKHVEDLHDELLAIQEREKVLLKLLEDNK